MNTTRKIITMLLAVILILSMAVPAMAAGNDGTITVTNATVGKNYTVYKIFDATIDGNGHIAYTYSQTLPTNNYFKQDSAGYITATDDAVDANGNLTSAATQFLGTLKGTAVKTSVAASETVVFDNLAYGYYYVETSNGTAVTVDSTNPDAVIIDKNQKSDFDKKIIVGYEQDGTPILEDVNTVNVGDKVEYQVKIDATNYNGAKYVSNYYVYDKMDEALTFNNDIKVTVNGTVLNAGAYTLVSGTDAGEFDFKINIPWVDADGNFLYNKTESVILVTYSATVNEKVKTSAPMKNEATYNFKDYSTPPTGPEQVFVNPNPEIGYKETNSYSSEIKICKVDDQGNALTGAKFSIAGDSYTVSIVSRHVFEEVGTTNGTHYMLKNGSFTTDAPILQDYEQDGVIVKANIDLYDSAEKKYALVEKITKDTDTSAIVSEGWVDEDGIMTFTGLGEGDYTITELVAPNGFNLLQNPIDVRISFDYDSKTFKAMYTDAPGATAKDASVSNGIISFNVVNHAGTELPSTGAKGTLLVITLGTVLFLGAAIVLVAKKRMYNAG